MNAAQPTASLTVAEHRVLEARTAAARALQLLVHEAATTGRPFLARDVAENFIDKIALLVLESIASHKGDSPDGH